VDTWVCSIVLGAEAEFREKATDQQPVVGLPAVCAERTLGFLGQKAKDVHRRYAHVQVEVELLLAACLAVGKSRMFGVSDHRSDHKLDLVAQAIVPGNLLSVLIGIC
jgi:hypothetical protein